MTPDGYNAREVERAALTRAKRDEELARRGTCSTGSCGTTYRLDNGDPVPPDSIPRRDTEVDKALRDIFIGLAIAAAYMTILVVLLMLL